MKSNRNKIFIYLVVFGAGVSVLAIELAASRLLAPYFGTSIFIWGNIIGIVLIALSLGYWVGGKLADKHPRTEYLMYLLLVAGILASFIPLFFSWYLEFVISNISFLASLIIGSFLAMILLFFGPVFLLGMVSPFALRILLSTVEESGKTAGSLYAFSTIGSIAGTFLSAFWLIPFWGTKETLYLSALILLLLGAVGLKKKPLYFLLVLFPLLLYFITEDNFIKPVSGLIYEKESPYQYLQIVKRDSQYNLLVNDGFGVQSIYDPNNILVESYYDYYSLLPFFQDTEEPKKVLLIGLGGGTISRQYLSFFKNISIDAVELDPEVVKAAKQFFDLADQKINIHIADGRSFLAQTKSTYDLLVVDAYAQQIYIPFHLTTQEFFQETKRHLKEQGILAMNVNAVSLDSDLLYGILQTLRSVYPYTYVASLGEGFNWLVVASRDSLDAREMQKRVSIPLLETIAEEISSQFRKIEPDNESMLFTDNKAPIEFLTEREIFDYFLSKSKS